MIRTYRELRRLKSFQERFDYLKLKGSVGESTFGFDRYINQQFYRSREWKDTRDKVILRDEACDLAVVGFEIYDHILIHHMNPVTSKDIETGNEEIFNLDFLICTTYRTHRAIHFGDESLLIRAPIERRPNDTVPWRQIKEE
jgi:hypothetical protein